MAVVRLHENFLIRTKRLPTGEVHVVFMEDTGAEVNVFPMERQSALDFAEEIKKKALDIEVPR